MRPIHAFIALGVLSLNFHRPAKSAMASRRSSLLWCRTSPSPKRSMNSNAAGTVSQLDGSRVPVQPKQRGNGCIVSEDRTLGSRPVRAFAAAQRKPQPRGTKYHLWRLATYQSALRAGMFNSIDQAREHHRRERAPRELGKRR